MAAVTLTPEQVQMVFEALEECRDSADSLINEERYNELDKLTTLFQPYHHVSYEEVAGIVEGVIKRPNRGSPTTELTEGEGVMRPDVKYTLVPAGPDAVATVNAWGVTFKGRFQVLEIHDGLEEVPITVTVTRDDAWEEVQS